MSCDPTAFTASSRADVRVAIMGGAYGNVPALRACIADARHQGADTLIFLGDATGCCGHSDEVLALIREHFDGVIAGNYEQQAVAGSQDCACGYTAEEDHRLGCEAHALAMRSLSETHRRWLATWAPPPLMYGVGGARLLLCHGSPASVNEFLYESELDDARLTHWLDEADATAMFCTHTGLPWIRSLPAVSGGSGHKFACNVGVTGKPDDDGDPAVHYAIVCIRSGVVDAEIRRVAYDHETWARQLAAEGVPRVFIDPLITGRWTTGVASLPDTERERQRP